MLIIKGRRSFEFGPMKLEFVIKEGGETLLFSLDKVKASQTTQEEGLLWIELVGLGLDFLFRADILEVFRRQVVGHLVAMDNPRCIVDVGCPVLSLGSEKS